MAVGDREARDVERAQADRGPQCRRRLAQRTRGAWLVALQGHVERVTGEPEVRVDAAEARERQLDADARSPRGRRIERIASRRRIVFLDHQRTLLAGPQVAPPEEAAAVQ